MRARIPLAILCLLSLGPNLSAAAGHVYLSPVPGSRNHAPGTNVIARFDRALDPSAIGSGWIVTTGSASGPHPGRTVLSDDRRTIVFQPDRPFIRGETVQVTVAGPGAGSAAYSFEIAKTAPPRFDLLSRLDLPRASESPAARSSATSADTLPPDFPAITSTVTGAQAPGQLFAATLAFGPGQPCYMLILDHAARPLFYRRSSTPIFDFRRHPNGQLTYFDAATATFVAMDSAGAVLDSIRCGNGYLTDPHELLILPNGHFLLLGLDFQVVDMSKVVEGGNEAAEVVGQIVQELDADKNVVFQWRSWDHFEITDATHEDLTASGIDYVHSNAIEVDADGNFLLSSRHMDEITKIDRETGETIWRWGGKHNEFEFIDDPLKFSHQHAIRWIGGHRYTMFDNGNYHPFQYSRAVEYELDEDARTARLVWQFTNGVDTFGFVMGNVQRLENGNTLISLGTGSPDVIEVRPDGTKVLEMTFPTLVSYRVSRSVWRAEPPEGTPTWLALSAAVPNPFRQSTRLTLDLARPTTVAATVYDVSGRKVLTVVPPRPLDAGEVSIDLSLSFLPPGLYFCRVEAGGQSQTRKVHLVR